jgi:hypothetical protein
MDHGSAGVVCAFVESVAARGDRPFGDIEVNVTGGYDPNTTKDMKASPFSCIALRIGSAFAVPQLQALSPLNGLPSSERKAKHCKEQLGGRIGGAVLSSNLRGSIGR